MALERKYKEDFILFLEAGFIAVNQADEDSAVKLFKACMLLDPTNSMSKVGMGYLHLHKLELKQACKCFEEVLKKEPSNEMAKTFLGLSLSMTPDQEDKGEEMLEKTKNSSDPFVKKLANTALDFVDKFVKKTPTPTEGQKRKRK